MRPLSLLFSIVFLSACSVTQAPSSSSSQSQNNQAVTMPANPAAIKDQREASEPIQPAIELTVDETVVLTLDRLTENTVIEFPLFISGTVRRDWVNEASFPITLRTLDDEILVEGYGTAAWLDPLPGDTTESMSGADMIPFVSGMNFVPPANAEVGKLRFTEAMPSGLPTADFVELEISWPE